jgi:hypothetical protein
MTVKQMDILNKNKWIVLIVTFAVATLATRFIMLSDVIYTVLLPYGALGIALSAFLPLIMGFVFIQQFDSGVLRKMFWSLFLITFLAMWDLHYNDAGAFSWIYFWSAVAALGLMLMDGTIRRALLKQKMRDMNIDSMKEFSTHIRRELRENEQDRTDGIISQSQYLKKKNRLNAQLNQILKY